MSELLDDIDRRILNELIHDARTPVTEIARRVGLSKTPVAARIKNMENLGLITGYRAMISPLKLGLSHVVYSEVKLNNTRESTLNTFNEAIKMIPEVEECYLIAGGFDYLLKIRTRNMTEYRRIMGEKISALPNVSSTSTYVAMETIVEDSFVDIGG